MLAPVSQTENVICSVCLLTCVPFSCSVSSWKFSDLLLEPNRRLPRRQLGLAPVVHEELENVCEPIVIEESDDEFRSPSDRFGDFHAHIAVAHSEADASKCIAALLGYPSRGVEYTLFESYDVVQCHGIFGN